MKSFRIQGQKRLLQRQGGAGLNIGSNFQDHDMRVRKDARMNRGPERAGKPRPSAISPGPPRTRFTMPNLFPEACPRFLSRHPLHHHAGRSGQPSIPLLACRATRLTTRCDRQDKDAPAMPVIVYPRAAPPTIGIDPACLKANAFSLSVYGDPSAEIDDLMPSVREHGILVPLVVAAPGPEPGTWEVVSGHRRLASPGPGDGRGPLPGPATAARPTTTAILEYNRQAAKHSASSWRSRRAGRVWGPKASTRRLAILRRGAAGGGGSGRDRWVRGCRLSGFRRSGGEGDSGRSPAGHASRRVGGRTDTAIARHLGMGGKDLYRQARRDLAAGPIRDTRRGAASPSSTPAPRRSMRPTRTSAAATDSGRLSPDAVRRLAVPARPGLRHPPPRLHSAGPGGACPPLLHRPGRPGG